MDEEAMRRMRKFTEILQDQLKAVERINELVQASHFLVLDAGLVEPKVPMSWEVEMEGFWRRQEGCL